ncbi:MAG: hypothetical protein ABJB49_06705 [Nitrospirota bacterium]
MRFRTDHGNRLFVTFDYDFRAGLNALQDASHITHGVGFGYMPHGRPRSFDQRLTGLTSRSAAISTPSFGLRSAASR